MAEETPYPLCSGGAAAAGGGKGGADPPALLPPPPPTSSLTRPGLLRSVGDDREGRPVGSRMKRCSGTGWFRATHGGCCPSLSYPSLPPRTNCTNGIWAPLKTTLCQLCSITTLRSCDVLILSTAKGRSPLQGWKQCEKDCRTDFPLWWLTPQ